MLISLWAVSQNLKQVVNIRNSIAFLFLLCGVTVANADQSAAQIEQAEFALIEKFKER